MVTRTRILLLVTIVAALLITGWMMLARNCPSAGIALTNHAATLHRMKNRTAIPLETDFDSRVTLDELLRPGNDANRWSTDRAARIQGYVVDVAYAGSEATNCFSPFRRDIHVLIAREKDVPKIEQVVMEVTPNLRDWAAQHGMDWSAEKLHEQLIGRWCEFEGWLYCDVGHADESQNTADHKTNNWRATAWEIHPITKITVIR
jgi:hypothetical protein